MIYQVALLMAIPASPNIFQVIGSIMMALMANVICGYMFSRSGIENGRKW